MTERTCDEAAVWTARALAALWAGALLGLLLMCVLEG